MTLRYAIRPAHPGAHLFHVTVTVDVTHPGGQRLMLPTWIPGSYMIREFARNIVRLTALAGDRKLRVTKLDKHTWQVAPARGPLTLAYEVYAWDLSVRAAHLDATHGFFNGPSVFLLPLGHEQERCVLDLLPPDGERFAHWTVATGLAPARGTRPGHFGAYVAANYDELIDCPVQMGALAVTRFDVLGTPHEIAITGSVPKLDGKRLGADVARMCAEQIRLFEPRAPRAPFARYSFLTLALGEAYGGLEHRNSTALICRREGLPYQGMKSSTEAYRRFLGLASHEYFHSWNVKRIRPAAFIPYDLTQENYTRLLWLFEGFTSYYDDLLLVRAGLLTEAQYLDVLSELLTTVTQRSGRLKQSVADSSFDAWIKYYRQDENAPNSVVSYYQKGALIGLALDLSLRCATRGRRSLDDVMRLLWQRWKEAGAEYRGVEEAEVAAAIVEATSVDLGRTLQEWTEGTRDPDFTQLLSPFGVSCHRPFSLEQPHFALLGIKTATFGSELRVANVFDGTPAQEAGVSGGDVLVALDDLRMTPTTLDKLLARYAIGDAVELTVFRRDELMRLPLRLASRAPQKYELKPDARSSKAAQRLRRGWLGGRAAA
jgi:predicted metalloprotease with PDZ domain